ncbi:MAG TPA: FAD-dependent oxidoreductase [Chitinophagaceae bacterium]|nr:FAD-dependent oxidoreductase [Chitinophagaceae bacterium]
MSIKIFPVSILSCLLLFASAQNNFKYDVCVYGGTSAGVIAAYSVAKMGKSVILIEPGKHLGGLSSGGLGYTDIGNKYAITGLALDFYRRMGKRYGKFEQWVFEPHVAEEIFDDYINRVKVKVLFGYRIARAEKDSGFITQIILENSLAPSRYSNKIISAKMFIDCSYEGDLMARAAVSYTVGREANNVYNETYNGVQLMDGHQFPDGVDPYKIAGDSTSGLLWGISKEKLAAPGSGDKKVQAYNFRICLTDDMQNMIPITRPNNYDSTRYELLLRLFDAQTGRRALNDYCIISKMPNHKTDINNRGAFSTDMIGVNYNYPEADYSERKKIIKLHEEYTKGLLYFYGHDPRVPEQLKTEMLKYGYPKDEYKDNGHWSPQLYIRESRRLVGAYVMTQANCQGRAVVDDGIAMAAYTMDSHNCERVIVNGMVRNEGNVEIGGFGPYPISYRSIIPKASECKNLFVPVCLSASHIAYGSIRMEPVFMELGQAAAVAACVATSARQTVQQVDVRKIQTILKENPSLDRSIPEVLADNDDSTQVSVAGSWKRLTSGGYGPFFLVAEPTKEEAQIRFRPQIKSSGFYAIYAYVPQLEKAASTTLFTIFDGNSAKNIFVRSHIHVEGQTSGEWIFLGKFKLPAGRKSYVAITNENADGLVCADAILFKPRKLK